MALRKAHSAGEVSDLELTILQELNKGLPTEKHMKFDLLIARRDAETITEEVYEELLRLTEEVESFDLKRLQLIAELAELRKISLAETVELFDIHPSTRLDKFFPRADASGKDRFSLRGLTQTTEGITPK